MSSNRTNKDITYPQVSVLDDDSRCLPMGLIPPESVEPKPIQPMPALDFQLVQFIHGESSEKKGKKRVIVDDEEVCASTKRSRRHRMKKKESNKGHDDKAKGVNNKKVAEHPVASLSKNEINSNSTIPDSLIDPALIDMAYDPLPKQHTANYRNFVQPPVASSSISLPKEISAKACASLSPDKEWLLGLREKWDAPCIAVIPKLHDVGTKIIDKMMRKENLPSNPVGESLMLLLGPPKRTSIAPSVRLVISDLLQATDPNVTDFLSRSTQEGIGPLDILASLMTSSTYCDMSSPDRRLYGAIDIPMTDRGLGMCNYRVERFEDGKENYIPKKVWTTTFTPPGGITHTHMDYYGRHQYMIHLFGHKLWLLWPPTEKNLEYFSSHHTQFAEHDLTERCIEEMEGLQAFYTTEEQIFVIKPNIFHACVSVSTSAHSATWFWRLETYKESMRLLDWGLNWLLGKVSSDAPTGDYSGEVYTFGDEMRAWKTLVKRNEENQKLSEVVEEMDELLKKVKVFMKPIKITSDGKAIKQKKRRDVS